MGRTRVLLVGIAAVVGVAAIAGGVHLSTRSAASTLATDSASIPDADVPTTKASHRDAVTDTTFDLGVLAPSTTDVPSATPTTAPKVTTAAVQRGFALVHINNATSTPVRVTLADVDDHAAVLPAGDHVDWVVKTASNSADRGSARVDGTNCGAVWSGVDNVVDGREYHLEIKPSAGWCAGGPAMPMVLLTDYTAGASKAITGLVPDASHAVVYVVNHYGAAVKVALSDDDEVEWTIDPTMWGAPQRVTTAADHGDGISVTRVDEPCGYGDSADYFTAGHAYRVEVVDGTGGGCTGATPPGLRIYDLTTQTTTLVGAA